MSEEIRVYESEKYTARVHPGKLSAEQRMALIDQAAQDFFREIIKAKGGVFGSEENHIGVGSNSGGLCGV